MHCTHLTSMSGAVSFERKISKDSRRRARICLKTVRARSTWRYVSSRLAGDAYPSWGSPARLPGSSARMNSPGNRGPIGEADRLPQTPRPPPPPTNLSKRNPRRPGPKFGPDRRGRDSGRAGFSRGFGARCAGAWIGTRFLASREATIHPRYRELVLKAKETDTVFVEELFDIGWPNAPHRVLRNKTVEAWEAAVCLPSGKRPGREK